MSASINRSLAVLAIAAAALFTACASPDRTGAAPLSTVPRVDLARYAGQWYEIDVTPLVTGNGAVGIGLIGSSSNGLVLPGRSGESISVGAGPVIRAAGEKKL